MQGSVEAIVTALNKISNEDIKVRVLHSGVGGITESDVTLARRLERADHRLQRPPQRQGARDRRARQGRAPILRRHLPPDRRDARGDGGRARAANRSRHVVGRAEIREVFPAGKHGKAAGLLVTEGVIRKALKARITARRRHHLQRRDRLAAALQGRCRRSPRRPRMRRDARGHRPTSSRATSSRRSRSRSANGRCNAPPREATLAGDASDGAHAHATKPQKAARSACSASASRCAMCSSEC